MNKNIIIGLVAVVVIGGVAWLVMDRRGTMPEEEQVTSTTLNTTTRSTLRDLALMGGSKKCTYAYEDDYTKTQGINYIADNKVRVETQTLDKRTNTQFTGSSIIDGEYIYSWTSQSNQGFKIKMDAATNNDASVDYSGGAPEATAPAQQNVDYNQAYDYDCTDWDKDESVLVPPTNITFVDQAAMMDEMMKKMNGMMPGAGAQGSLQVQ